MKEAKIMQDTNLGQCYQSALRYASDIGKECGALSNEFPGDSDLYKKASVGGIFADALSFHVTVFNYVGAYRFSKGLYRGFNGAYTRMFHRLNL
jgi:hypothetical protein